MSNFVEYRAISKSRLDDMVSELENLKSKNQQPTIPNESQPNQLPEEESKSPKVQIDEIFGEVINSLPIRCRDHAKQMITQLLKGKQFGYDFTSGELLKYAPEEGFRYRIPCSNLRDILCSITKQLGPNQQPQSEETMVQGLKEFLEMLASTPFGASQIFDPNLRKIFQKFRKHT